MDWQKWFGGKVGLLSGIGFIVVALVVLAVMLWLAGQQQQVVEVVVTPTPKTERPEGAPVALMRQEDDRSPVAGLTGPVYATGVKDAGFLNMHTTILWILILVVALTILEAVVKRDPADALCLLVPVLVVITTWIKPNEAWSLALLVASIAGVLALAASGQGGMFDFSAPSSTLFLVGLVPIVRGSLGFIGSVLGVRATSWFSFGFTWLLLVNDEVGMVTLSVLGYTLIILGILLRVAEVARSGGQDLIVSLAGVGLAVFLYQDARLTWHWSLLISTILAVLASVLLYIMREGKERGGSLLDMALERLEERSWPLDVGALVAQALALMIIG